MSIRCTWEGCGQSWAVSEEDPDSTLYDAFDHVTSKHYIGPSMAHNWIEES